MKRLLAALLCASILIFALFGLTSGAGGGLTVEGIFTQQGPANFYSTVALNLVNAAGGSANPFDYTATLGVMDGSDDFTLFDVNITNANHLTATNTIQVLDIAGITADAQATETAINIGNGWDVGLNAGNNSITTSGGITGGALTGTSAAIGGGYASTGCDISDAGVLQCAGAATTDGVLTAASVVIGGGYFSTGCTLSSAGVLQCTGAMTSDGALLANTGAFTSTLAATGAAALNGGIAVDTSNFTVSGDTGAVSSASSVTAASLTTSGDVTITPDATGGNAGAKSELIGLPKITMAALGVATNGITETTSYTDDSPANEWVAISTTVTITDDAAIYRIGSKSLKLTFTATAVDDDGAKNDITNDNLEGDTSVGFWLRSDTVLAATDVKLLIDDDTADTVFSTCAVATVNVWQWCEVDITSLAAGTGDVVEQVGLVLKNAAGLGAFNIWVDGMWKWAVADEEPLGQAILPGGVLSVMAIPTLAATNNTPTTPVENTDYFVHYETGSDFLVWITDQSANSNVALLALQ